MRVERDEIADPALVFMDREDELVELEQSHPPCNHKRAIAKAYFPVPEEPDQLGRVLIVKRVPQEVRKKFGEHFVGLHGKSKRGLHQPDRH